MLTLATFEELLGDRGQNALALTHTLEPTTTTYPAHFDRLRKHFSEELSRAVLDQVILRRKAKGKFPEAEQMYFTTEGLSMSSSPAVSRHRAKRYANCQTVADLCCGIGMDAIALAKGNSVVAIDNDPLMVAMTRANAAALGIDLRAETGDALQYDYQATDAVFVDPARRTGSHRVLDVESYAPPLSAFRKRIPAHVPWGVKLAPGIPRDNLALYPEAEAEFISLNGELKECVFWFGDFAKGQLRATAIQGDATHELTGTGRETCDLTELRGYLLDPDASITRSGLVARLANELGAAEFEPGLAMLTSDGPVSSPFVDAYPIEAIMPWDAKKIRAYLQAHNIGDVTLYKRGVDMDSDEARKKLKLPGGERRAMFLVKYAGKITAVICGLRPK
ncbi:MAG: class I SAM-dependent methyltransferase [Fimbriiglobus sp.]